MKGRPLAFYSPLGTRTCESNFPLWEPSQYGLLFDNPQRQREKAGFAGYTLPSPSINSTSPVILNEPLSFTLICTFDKESTPFIISY